MYYRGASAAVLVYDITSAFSYNKVKEWVNELKVNVTDDITMVVVGNKLDRAQKHRQLQTEVGQEYATSVGASFTETSAKTGEGIEAVFLEIAKKLIKNSEEKHTVAESDKVTSSSGGGLNVNSPNGKTNEISDSCCQD
eukprot:TRINITY_DN613_c0_g1_i3.p1 TRINITY_DN613_c0_g1~~TRINITY_DN613_c0_g1_i3.p1  ORF type:complete len:139 (-),score=25.78 TRINITY_DN613_c0_g1_i3:85-501(-)